MARSRSNSSGLSTPILVLTEIPISVPSKILPRKRSSSSGYPRNPAPRFLAATVPEGQPRFRFTSSYPNSLRISAVCRKSSQSLVRIWGTTGTPSLCSGSTSFSSRERSPRFFPGDKKGVKYRSTPPNTR